MSSKQPRPLWKDLVNVEFVSGMAAAFGEVHKRFKQDAFANDVIAGDFFELELKDRLNRIAHTLVSYLPVDFAKAADLLLKVAPRVGEMENWALTAYVEHYGLDHFDDSMRALKGMTPYGTGEFAVRPFMIKYLPRMLPILAEWAEDPNEHVRRLAAEASRPRGVWTAHIVALKQDPQPIIKLLEKLKADDSLYVRKAVANNLNDIAKDHPEVVIETARRWLAEGNRHTDWIVKRGCRGLVREGHPAVFPLLGFAARPRIEVLALKVTPVRVKIGSAVTLILRFRSLIRKPQKLAIDYRLIYARPNGKSSRKVFKWSEVTVGPAETVGLTIERSFRDLSTRRHQPGMHAFELLVNGVALAQRQIKLVR